MNHLTSKVRGTHIAYSLALEGDENSPMYVYCGSTQDIEKRMAQHCGGIEGGSRWCALHKPTRILDIIPCRDEWQAVCTEVALWGFHASKLKDANAVRGGRYCMTEALMYPPPGWPREREMEEFPSLEG